MHTCSYQVLSKLVAGVRGWPNIRNPPASASLVKGQQGMTATSDFLLLSESSMPHLQMGQKHRVHS